VSTERGGGALLHSTLATVVHIDRSSRRRRAVVLSDGVSVIREAVHVGRRDGHAAAAAAAVTRTRSTSPAATSDRPTGDVASEPQGAFTRERVTCSYSEYNATRSLNRRHLLSLDQ